MHDREATEDSLVEADGLTDFAAARQAGSSSLASGSFKSRDAGGGTRGSTRHAVYGRDDGDSGWHSVPQLPGPPPQHSAFDRSSSCYETDSRSPALHPWHSYTAYSSPTQPSPAPTYSLDSPHSPPLFPSFPPSAHHPSSYVRPTSSYATVSNDAPFAAPTLLFDDPVHLPPSPSAHSAFYRDPFSHNDVDDDEARGDLAYALIDERDKGEWFEAAGSYQQGVGFEGVSGSKRLGLGQKAAARMEKLERKFGQERSTDAAGVSAKQRMKEAKDATKAEKLEVQRTTGVDDKGRLVVMGRRKRLALRWFQAGGAVIVGIGSIGAAVLTHPKDKPPPSGSAPLLILYLLPFLSLFLTTYLFAIRPLLYKRRSHHSPQPQAGLAMPLLQQEQPQPTGGWCDCLGESRRRVPRGQYHPPQFNLIVDPRLMAAMQGQTSEEGGRASRRGRQKRRKKRRHPRSPLDDQRATDSSSSSDSDGVNSDLSSGEEDPWTARSSSSSNPRKSLLSHVLLDTTWRQARSWAKKVAVADAVCAVGWGGVAGWAVTGGKRCPAGGFEGYCNLYNTALAFSFLLSASFVASFALDCFDLSRTKVSPRHRQQRLRDGVV